MNRGNTEARAGKPDSLRFLTPEQVRYVREQFGTPVYVYHEAEMERQAQHMLGLPNAFGLTVRYSIKANGSGAVLKIFDRLGLYFDACSEGEALRAIRAGVAPSKITLTGQEMPVSLDHLVEMGIEFNACSIRQLEIYGARFPGSEVSVRLNPGLGSGAGKRLVTGGARSSFGIWHERLDDVKKVLAKYNLRVKRVHHHIGSGHDPEAWLRISALTLDLSAKLGSVPIINLGGGYRIKAMTVDEEIDYYKIAGQLREVFYKFAEKTGNKPVLEIEPGTFLIANAGALVTTVLDVVSTGKDGYDFIKVNAGLTELLRPAFYGAQHPMVCIPASEEPPRAAREYMVSGHTAVPGDILTTMPGNPEEVSPRLLAEAEPNDLLVIERAGGYCASMSMKNFNSFLEAPEVLLRKNATFALIRKRQTLEQLLENEIIPQDI